MTLPTTLSGRLDEFLNRIAQASIACGRKEPRRQYGDSYLCCCPAHDDKNPSLSVKLEGSRILLHCFAGCEPDDVAEAVGMPMQAFFDDYHGENGAYPMLKWNGQGQEASKAAASSKAEVQPMFHVEHDEEWVPLLPDAEEFVELKYPPIEPILGPWTSQQINLLFAPSGVGKTMFGLSLAYAMAEGLDFLGWQFHGDPRTVIYLDGEMPAGMMQERLEEARSKRLFVANVPGWWADQVRTAQDRGASVPCEELNLATEAGRDLLSLWVELHDADVVFLDNFMSLAWQDGTSYSSDEVWSDLKRWCTAERARGKCIILVDHANVRGGVFGTKTKLNVMDLVCELEPIDGPTSLEVDSVEGSWARMKFSKTRGIQLSCDSQGGAGDSLSGVNQREVRIARPGITWEVRDSAGDLVKQIAGMREDGMTIRQIAEELDVSFSKVQRTWKRVQSGLIQVNQEAVNQVNRPPHDS